MKIKALVVEHKDAPFVLQEIDLEEPGRGEALVRIVASGVCHTDAVTRAGDMPMPFPSVLGHEGAGVVERVGPGVTEVSPVRQGHYRLAVLRYLPQLSRRSTPLLPQHRRSTGIGPTLQRRGQRHIGLLTQWRTPERPFFRTVIVCHPFHRLGRCPRQNAGQHTHRTAWPTGVRPGHWRRRHPE
ncbi:alcohol dehydrogenase catalytic domain-containing protein [Neopusillimonas aromaticivorans]|uniref:alcohol dehydrogenase catalytic domain-containing protein n=1 Tax=Neopusillimonas aromaticivorans TaxID=2979868 RepID=UPI003315D148